MLQQVFNKENDSIKLKHTIPSIPIYFYSSFNYPRSECQTLIPNSIHTCPCLANLLLSNIPNIREKFTVFHNQYVNFLHLQYFFEKLNYFKEISLRNLKLFLTAMNVSKLKFVEN